MTEIRRDQQVEEIIADLDARNILYPEPPDLPPAAALVRLPGGMIGEVVLWLDRNPQGTLWFSGLRVVLVELVEPALPRSSIEEPSPKKPSLFSVPYPPKLPSSAGSRDGRDYDPIR